MMKSYLLKTILFIFTFIVFNTIIQYLILVDRESFLFQFKRSLEKQQDVIVFGSSIDNHHRSDWKDKRPMSELIDSLTTQYKITDISRPSASVENCYNYLSYSVKREVPPKKVVVPLNIRSFTFEWATRPEYDALIARERIFLEYGSVAYIYRNVIPHFSREINQVSHMDFFNSDVYVNAEKVGKVKDFVVMDISAVKDSLEYQKNSCIMNYLSDFPLPGRKLNYLAKFDSLCKANQIETLYYFPPIDYNTVVKYLGPQSMQGIRKQIDIIKNTLPEGTNFLDLVFELDSSYFDYDLMINEHMYQKGKLYVAKRISDELGRISD